MRKGAFYFLELPVYRLPEDEYYEKRSTGIDSMVNKYASPITPLSPSIAKRLAGREDKIREHLRNTYGGAWRYNEIIGYVRLHLLSTQIRGEFWRDIAKQIVSTRLKRILGLRAYKLAPETELPTAGSNNEIYLAILEHVDDCRKELKKHYLDDEQLITIGPHVKWRELFEWD